jgi:thiol-disulfide isomerase/thioredoxin
MDALANILAQCPCSGGGGGSGGGMSQFAWLMLFALAFGLWQAVKWTRVTWNTEGTSNMSRFMKVGLILVLVASMGAVVGTQLIAADEADAPQSKATTETSGVPKLLDLGSKSCIPCKKMAPILDELKKDYAGKFDVEFIDVGERENAAKAKQYGVNLIPTQIFFDKDGKELWRHEGFLSKADILAKWKELGFVFEAETPTDTPDVQRKASPSTQSATAPATEPNTVARAYPNLVSAALVYARPVDLPEGVLLQAGDLKVTQKDIDAEIAKAPEAMREQLRKNAFFLLEQMATRQLLVKEAKAAATKDGKDVSKLSEQELLKAYFDKLTADVKVTDAEVAEFYEKNKDMVGGQPLEAVKEAIANFLRQQKQQEIVDNHIQTLGQRKTIEVASAWLKHQAELAMDNPVDKARASGKPSLVDFGAKGCIPCDKLAPILEAMKTKFEGKANVVFVSVREEQVLASRYGIQSIPVQIFFDKDGKEVFRHSGFWPQEELEKKLAEIGVR